MRSTLSALVGTVLMQNELNDVNWIDLNGLVGAHPKFVYLQSAANKIYCASDIGIVVLK